ncbi:3-hydroxyacyl-CoA dehydrogenase NAD-binding domain-containing protein [Rhizobiaceae bacterium BDR2-2]|uniref:3-hydroxyacyl-CoA dehydrogenase NAD-binding domain-containing protein n=1 Tax=Ectorhizobium quercum TaxID=2965071 RepID=A0AAE3MWF0_9HYPH|nr:3-hydroxyacyl-CoA dehydrogenase/enoyl-CoA hydratase family protein [Ectorhizobium quercum]MCX8995577.1 3-hydroxyacyl-CoA dehydrogenase NAD-binding domain-containing protein [Ectorhizobium quercum]
MTTIEKATVIGAGTMGSGIAAHLANAGVSVTLLDMDAKLAEAGVARQLKAGGFMDTAFAAHIRTGSSVTDLALAADSDWIVEAIAEKPEIKQGLYRALEAVRKPGSIVSSNTSTIPLARLTEGMPERFADDFLITHFFNPPRRMRLFELVAGGRTRADARATIADFADRRLGKAVVLAKDTPGFIGNRIGNYWMMVAENEAIARGLTVEEADAIIGRPFGIPSTGIFGLLDLVGIDLMATILKSLQGALPATDPMQDYAAEPPLVTRMIAENRLGRKSGAGFVKLSADRKSREITDLATGEYRPMQALASAALAAAKGDARVLMDHDSPGGRFAAIVMGKTLAYAAALVPEIADTPQAVDEAMRTGYGWKSGPFELIDRLGPGWLAGKLETLGVPVPAYLAAAARAGSFYSVRDGKAVHLGTDGDWHEIDVPEGVVRLAALKLSTAPVMSGEAANLWDLGNGVAGLELRTKMNTFSPAALDAVVAALDAVEKDFGALVIGGDADPFSAGADLRQFLSLFETEGREALGRFVDRGQQTFRALKFAPFPVVSATSGLALGGGAEITLHSAAVQAHAELSIGLVETKIGLIPGWGGCKEMLLRFSETLPPLDAAKAAFDLIAGAKTSGSAYEARNLGLLRATDGVTMNRERLIADAKARARDLLAGYEPPAPRAVTITGAEGFAALTAALDAEGVTAHDRVVGAALARVLTGGDAAAGTTIGEDALTALERKAFLDLLETPATVARIRHMLETGKPLRN